MWRGVFGKDKPEEPSSSSKKKEGEARSQRKRSESITSPTSTRKPSRGDDRDRGFNPSSTSYSSSSQSPYPGTAAPSVASSYATARSTNFDGSVNAPELIRNASLADNMPKTKSERDGKSRDKDRDRDKKAGRRRDRSSSREKKVIGRRDRSRSEDRSSRIDKRDIGPLRRNTDGGVLDAKEATRAGELASFDAQVGGTAFTQFPGQYDAGLPGPSNGHSIPSHEISSHVPDMFPGQFPTEASTPYRPPLARNEGGPGLAAEYYGDTGESVAHQPGVRPATPSLIVGAEPHLMAASSVAAPPTEPSAMGGVGAAASFFSGASFASPSTSPKPAPDSAPLGHQPQYHSQGSQSFPRPNIPLPSRYSPSSVAPMNISGSIPTLGAAAAAGAAAAYTIGTHGSSSYHQEYHSSQDVRPPINSASDYRPPPSQSSQPFSESQAYTNSTLPPKPGKPQSSSSNLPYVAAAGAAGLAAAAYHNSHDDHHSSSYQHYSNSQYNGGAVAQKHRHHGPFTKLVDFFRDPEGVAQFEEYTEYIGVCKACFDPGSTPRDAPRKHHPRRRRSNDRFDQYGSSTRIDKENRYWSSDGDNRRRKKSSWLAGGIAGYGLAQVGKSLFSNNRDFDDTYSVHSGRINGSASSLNHHRRAPSPDRSSRTSHGVTKRRSSDVRSSDKIEYGVTASGEVYKKTHHDSVSGAPAITTYVDRRKRSRSRSRSRHRKSSLAGVALGAAIGSTAAVASRKRSPSPKGALLRVKHRSRSNSPDTTSSGKRKTRRSRHSPEPQSGIFGDFFTSPPDKKRNSHKKKKKKSTGFFTFSNSSASSSDSILAFGQSHTPARSEKTTSTKINSAKDANAALVGLGAAAAALAAAEGRSSSKGKHHGGVVAVKESKGKHRGQSDHEHSKKQRKSSNGIEEDLWESTSEDNGYSSVDSALAFGLSHRRSQDSLSDSGTEKWGWRWGSKKKRTPSLQHDSHQLGDAGISGMVGAATGLAVGTALQAHDHRHRDPIVSATSTISPMQHVYPVSTSDPTNYDAARRDSAKSHQPLASARPGPIPLQQPQPVMPVSASIYSTQVPYDQSFTAPSGPTVFAQPAQNISHNNDYDHRMSMPGTFPEVLAREDNKSNNERDIKNRRRNSSPTVAKIESKSKRASTRDESSGVRFDFTKEQEERHRRGERRDKRRSDRSRQALDRRDSEERSELDRDRRRTDVTMQKRDSDRREADRREAEEQAEIERQERARREAEIIKEGKSEREAEIARELARLAKAEPPASKPRKMPNGTDVTNPVLAGIAGAAMSAAMAYSPNPVPQTEQEQRAREDRQDRRRGERRAERREEKRDDKRRESEDRTPVYAEERQKPKQSNSSGRSSGFAGIVATATGSTAAEGTKSEPTRDKRSPAVSRDTGRDQSSSIVSGKDEKSSKSESGEISRERKPAERVAVRIRRSPSPAQYESYADYFAPSDILSKPAVGKEKVNSPNADNGIRSYQAHDVVTIEPGGNTKSAFTAPDIFTSPDDVSVVDNRYLSWKVPHLNLIQPTPPVSRAPSRAGSTRASPVIQPHDAKIVEEDEESDTSRKVKVTFGDNQTHEYDVFTPEADTPNDHREGYITKSDYVSVAELSKKSLDNDTPNMPREVETPVEEIKRSMPGEFGNDIDFAATVAAGLEESGLDPDLVIEDSTYHRRNSPPGSGNTEFYHQPFYQTVSDIALESPRSRGAPPQRGWVEGELPPTPKAETKPASSLPEAEEPAMPNPKTSKKDKRKEKKASRRSNKDQDDSVSQDIEQPNGKKPNETAQESTASTLNNIPVVEAEPVQSVVSGKQKADKFSNFVEDIRIDSPERGKNEKARAKQTSTIVGADEPQRYDMPVDARDAPLPEDDTDTHSSPKSGERDKERDSDDQEIYESPNEYAGSVVSAPSGEKRQKHRKKSKRRSTGDNDAASIVSSPAKFDDGSGGKGKKEKKGGLFGLFSKSSEETTEKRRSKDGTGDVPEDFEESKRKKKSHRRSRDDSDMYSIAPQSVADLSKLDDDEESKRSRRSRDKEEKRRSRRDSKDDGESGRHTQDLPNKVHTSSLSGHSADVKCYEMLTFFKIPDLTDTTYSATQTNLKGDPPERLQRTSEQEQPPSFLGMRREISEPPDISGDELAVGGSLMGTAQGQRRSNSSPPSRLSTPDKIDWTKSDYFSQEIQSGSGRRLSMLQSDGSHPPGTPSSTAVPLVFRKPPGTGATRSASATPLQSPSLVTSKQRKPRPWSAELKSNEFRPLWLVERYNPKKEVGPDEVLHSLSSSHSTLRASSVHEGDFSERSHAGRDFQPQLTLNTEATQDTKSDLLHSQQTMPTAASYHHAKKEQDLLDEARQEVLSREIEWNQKHAVEHQRRDPEPTPVRNTKSLGDQGVVESIMRDEHEKLETPDQSLSKDSDKPSLATDLSVAALAASAITTGSAMLEQKEFDKEYAVKEKPETSRLSQQEGTVPQSERMDLVSPSVSHSKSVTTFSETLEDQDTAEFGEPDHFVSKKAKKKSKKGKHIGKKEDGTGSLPMSSAPAKPSNEVVPISPEERVRQEEQDTQDAVDSWFAPSTPRSDRKAKKGKKGRALSSDLASPSLQNHGEMAPLERKASEEKAVDRAQDIDSPSHHIFDAKAPEPSLSEPPHLQELQRGISREGIAESIIPATITSMAVESLPEVENLQPRGISQQNWSSDASQSKDRKEGTGEVEDSSRSSKIIPPSDPPNTLHDMVGELVDEPKASPRSPVSDTGSLVVQHHTEAIDPLLLDDPFISRSAWKTKRLSKEKESSKSKFQPRDNEDSSETQAMTGAEDRDVMVSSDLPSSLGADKQESSPPGRHVDDRDLDAEMIENKRGDELNHVAAISIATAIAATSAGEVVSSLLRPEAIALPQVNDLDLVEPGQSPDPKPRDAMVQEPENSPLAVQESTTTQKDLKPLDIDYTNLSQTEDVSHEIGGIESQVPREIIGNDASSSQSIEEAAERADSKPEDVPSSLASAPAQESIDDFQDLPTKKSTKRKAKGKKGKQNLPTATTITDTYENEPAAATKDLATSDVTESTLQESATPVEEAQSDDELSLSSRAEEESKQWTPVVHDPIYSSSTVLREELEKEAQKTTDDTNDVNSQHIETPKDNQEQLGNDNADPSQDAFFHDQAKNPNATGPDELSSTPISEQGKTNVDRKSSQSMENESLEPQDDEWAIPTKNNKKKGRKGKPASTAASAATATAVLGMTMASGATASSGKPAVPETEERGLAGEPDETIAIGVGPETEQPGVTNTLADHESPTYPSAGASTNLASGDVQDVLPSEGQEPKDSLVVTKVNKYEDKQVPVEAAEVDATELFDGFPITKSKRKDKKKRQSSRMAEKESNMDIREVQSANPEDDPISKVSLDVPGENTLQAAESTQLPEDGFGDFDDIEDQPRSPIINLERIESSHVPEEELPRQEGSMADDHATREPPADDHDAIRPSEPVQDDAGSRAIDTHFHATQSVEEQVPTSKNIDIQDTFAEDADVQGNDAHQNLSSGVNKPPTDNPPSTLEQVEDEPFVTNRQSKKGKKNKRGNKLSWMDTEAQGSEENLSQTSIEPSHDQDNTPSTTATISKDIAPPEPPLEFNEPKGKKGKKNRKSKGFTWEEELEKPKEVDGLHETGPSKETHPVVESQLESAENVDVPVADDEPISMAQQPEFSTLKSKNDKKKAKKAKASLWNDAPETLRSEGLVSASTVPASAVIENEAHQLFEEPAAMPVDIAEDKSLADTAEPVSAAPLGTDEQKPFFLKKSKKDKKKSKRQALNQDEDPVSQPQIVEDASTLDEPVPQQSLEDKEKQNNDPSVEQNETPTGKKGKKAKKSKKKGNFSWDGEDETDSPNASTTTPEMVLSLGATSVTTLQPAQASETEKSQVTAEVEDFEKNEPAKLNNDLEPYKSVDLRPIDPQEDTTTGNAFETIETSEQPQEDTSAFSVKKGKKDKKKAKRLQSFTPDEPSQLLSENATGSPSEPVLDSPDAPVDTSKEADIGQDLDLTSATPEHDGTRKSKKKKKAKQSLPFDWTDEPAELLHVEEPRDSEEGSRPVSQFEPPVQTDLIATGFEDQEGSQAGNLTVERPHPVEDQAKDEIAALQQDKDAFELPQGKNGKKGEKSKESKTFEPEPVPVDSQEVVAGDERASSPHELNTSIEKETSRNLEAVDSAPPPQPSETIVEPLITQDDVHTMSAFKDKGSIVLPSTDVDDEFVRFTTKKKGKKSKKSQKLSSEAWGDGESPSRRDIAENEPEGFQRAAVEPEASVIERPELATSIEQQVSLNEPDLAENGDEWSSFNTSKRKNKKGKKQKPLTWVDDTTPNQSKELYPATTKKTERRPSLDEETKDVVLPAPTEQQQAPEELLAADSGIGQASAHHELYGSHDNMREEGHGSSQDIASNLPAVALLPGDSQNLSDSVEVEPQAIWDSPTTKKSQKNKKKLKEPGFADESTQSSTQLPGLLPPIIPEAFKGTDEEVPVTETTAIPQDTEQRAETNEAKPKDAWDIPVKKKKGKKSQKQQQEEPWETPGTEVQPPHSSGFIAKDRERSRERSGPDPPLEDYSEKRKSSHTRSGSLSDAAKATGAVGASIALFEGLHRSSSISEQRPPFPLDVTKPKKKKKGKKWAEPDDEPIQEPVASIESDYVKHGDQVSRQQSQSVEDQAQHDWKDEYDDTSRGRSINRDSAVHIPDSPQQHESIPYPHNLRDSGYQGTEGSPVIPDDSDHFDRNLSHHSERTSKELPFTHDSEERPLNISIEVDPRYDVSISRAEHVGQASGRSFQKIGKPESPPHEQRLDVGDSPTLPHINREPSTVDTTTKDRSATLFSSSPSIRDDSHYHARQRGLEAITTPITGQTKSLFGGPVGINSDLEGLRSPPRTPIGFDSATGPLTTIAEHSPEDSPLRKKGRDLSDVGEPDHALKAARRSGTPQSISSRRAPSPHSENARRLGLISTDDLISRLSWPEVDEENHSVDLERSRSRNRDNHGDRGSSGRRSQPPSLIIDPARHPESERRSISGASIRSSDSINAIIRSPATHSSSTPPLRRVDRSVSSDLRAASRRSGASGASNDDAKAAKPGGAEADRQEQARELQPDEAQQVIASSSTYDPTTDKGKGRITKMTDVYVSKLDIIVAVLR